MPANDVPTEPGTITEIKVELVEEPKARFFKVSFKFDNSDEWIKVEEIEHSWAKTMLYRIEYEIEDYNSEVHLIRAGG